MISVAVPTCDMQNKEDFLVRLLESLWRQTFQDFEIVITDNSDDGIIEGICNYYKTGITYYRNPNKGMAQNTNEAIRRSKGDLVKIIYMDDFLTHPKSLEKILKAFTGSWLVTGCTHVLYDVFGLARENFNDHIPHYSEDIVKGNNTIGSPSVLTIKNDQPLLFDEQMTWLLDCDYYHRLHQAFGEPVVIKDINVTIGLHPGQATNLLPDELKLAEHNYIEQKYA